LKNFAFVFPGQGSQFPGMGKFLVEQFTTAKQVFEEASDALKLDLKKLCFQSSESDLALTYNTQPAIFVTSVAALKVLEKDFSMSAVLTAGHSVGEYAALVASQAISIADGINAVRLRGTWMQEAVPVGVGSMAAVMGLSADETVKMCQWAIKESKITPLSAANFNCPGQIVISGKKAAIEWLSQNLNAEKIFNEPKKIKLIPLQVSAPFHCEMMMPAQEKMKAHLKTVNFNDAKIPVVQNLTGRLHSKKTELYENLVHQISGPVLWMQSVQEMKAQGVQNIVEVGAGKVLAGLIKKIDSEWFQVSNLNSLEDFKLLEEKLKN
jgi:[acyl-carrier-protein] S-malonyltransferase